MNNYQPLFNLHYWTLAIFTMPHKPSLRALAKQSSSDFQLKIGLDCFTAFAKTAFQTALIKLAKVELKHLKYSDSNSYE